MAMLAVGLVGHVVGTVAYPVKHVLAPGVVGEVAERAIARITVAVQDFLTG